MNDQSFERICKVPFASVYPHYVAKVEKKGRTVAELNAVVQWLLGYDSQTIKQHLEDKTNFYDFFSQASINPNASKITGVICGYRVEEIEPGLKQQFRYLDKLVDELAKGKPLEKILRTP